MIKASEIIQKYGTDKRMHTKYNTLNTTVREIKSKTNHG